VIGAADPGPVVPPIARQQLPHPATRSIVCWLGSIIAVTNRESAGSPVVLIAKQSRIPAVGGTTSLRSLLGSERTIDAAPCQQRGALQLLCQPEIAA